MTTEATEKTPKGRSPSYPGVSIDLAIEKARITYERQSKHPGNVETLMTAWGYSPKSGPGSVTFAALRKYGLLEVEGVGAQRKAKLTPLALHILLDPTDASRREAIRQAALTPPIHRELLEQYEWDLPADDVLAYELVMERGFTQGGAIDFLSQFRRTIDYAQLTDARVGGEPAPTERDAMPNATATRPQPAGPIASPPKSSRTRFLQIPLEDEGLIRLETSRPLTDDEWEMLVEILPAMKRGFMAKEKDES